MAEIGCILCMVVHISVHSCMGHKWTGMCIMNWNGLFAELTMDGTVDWSVLEWTRVTPGSKIKIKVNISIHCKK